MLIQINGAEVQASDAIRQHIEKTVTHDLQHYERQVTRVEVHLHDANAGKGGVDKRVVLEARLAGHQPLAVEQTDKDMYNAITTASGKLARAVKHKLERHDAHKSSHG